jgi:hypothetical protein
MGKTVIPWGKTVNVNVGVIISLQRVTGGREDVV